MGHIQKVFHKKKLRSVKTSKLKNRFSDDLFKVLNERLYFPDADVQQIFYFPRRL